MELAAALGGVGVKEEVLFALPLELRTVFYGADCFSLMSTSIIRPFLSNKEVLVAKH